MLEIRVVEKMYASNVLNDNAKRIRNAAETIEQSSLTIAAIITETAVHMSSNEYDKNANGFKNVHEWTEDAFGLKQASSYNYLKVGMYFIEPIRNERGVITRYACKLKNSDGTNTKFTYAQILCMLKYYESFSELQRMVYDGIISDTMSSRKLKEVLDAHFKKSGNDESGDSGNEEESGNSGGGSDENVIYIEVKSADGTVFKVPESVLEQYKVADVDTTATES